MSEQTLRPEKPRIEKPQGAVAKTVSWVFGLLGALVVALVLSVVTESVGIVAQWWPSDHAQVMLTTERGYLEAIDQFPLTALAPVTVVRNSVTHVDNATAGIRQTAIQNRDSDPLAVYVLAAINTVKLMLLRLVVCLFSLPGYGVIAIAALVDGLVQRDIRKFTGGHESSYVFHKAKRWVLPGILGTITLYLLLPWSLYPAVAFAPSMALFGLMLYVASSRFKKFL